MKKTIFNWQMPDTINLPADFLEIIQTEKIPLEVGAMIWNRGIQTREGLCHFLHPNLDQLHDPYLLNDMEKAISRVQEALFSGEKILIYGDYDADGITSTVVMKEALELLGADVTYYLPNRFKDGYGPNLDVYKEKIALGIQLIITVDNGVSGHEAIQFAKEQGVDVIITDHHELPSVLPEAYAIIHPKHPNGKYPFGELAGVGVAFKFACALLEEVPVEFLDMVAIGTIADMVSLTNENRVLVHLGLKQMKQGERLGLNELLLVSSISLPQLDETSIGFSISPRLNAIGRLGDPNPAVELLTTFDEKLAKNLAGNLNEINEERKSLVDRVTKEALEKVKEEDMIHIIIGDGWHEGILGIVAGKIMRQTQRPTIVLTKKEDGRIKGSGRSIETINLFDLVSEVDDLLLNFGGHHSAIGLTVSEGNFKEFYQKLQQNIQKFQAEIFEGIPLKIDGILNSKQIDLPFVQSLNVMAPFGMDNPTPQFLLKEAYVETARQIGGEGRHLKFSIKKEAYQSQDIDVIGFGFGENVHEFQQTIMDIVGRLSINEWNGNRLPQLLLEDYLINDLQIIDYRAKKYYNQIQITEQSLVVYFNKQTKQVFPKEIMMHSVYIDNNTFIIDKSNFNATYQSIVLLDCPENLENIKELVTKLSIEQLVVVFYSNEDAYVDGVGSREQYARLFQFIKKTPRVDVRYKLKEVATYLKIPEKLLVFMVRVFQELGFVEIENGIMIAVDNPRKKTLDSSQLFQRRKNLIKTEEFLLLSNITELKNWLTL